MAEKSFRTCEVVQELTYIKMEDVKDALSTKMVKDYAYIIHDKDIKEDGTLKAPHIHIILRLKESYKSSSIGKAFGVAPQYVVGIKGRFSDGLKYLTHMNTPDKFQYADSDVVSNFDFKLERTLNQSDVRKSEIMNKIVSGEIRRFNLFNYVTVDEGDKYNSSIEYAFKYRINKIKNEVNRSMKVIYIQGAAGSGKSTMAKRVAEENKMSVYISSGSNDVLDDYEGQDCLILDDLRPSCMGLSDLLKMLDNNTSSTVKSRYKNKMLECKLIIITTVIPLEEFFNKVFKEEKEPITQLKRRCTTLIIMDKMKIKFYGYDVKLEDHKFAFEMPNDILDEYAKSTDIEQQTEDVINMFAGVSKYLEKNKDSIIKEAKENMKKDKEVPF